MRAVIAFFVFYKFVLSGKFMKIVFLQKMNERIVLEDLDVDDLEMEIGFRQML